MSISFKNLLLVLSSIDPAGCFKFGETILNRELVFGLSTVAHDKTICEGEICGEGGGDVPGDPTIVVDIEGEAGVRKARRRCARKVVVV